MGIRILYTNFKDKNLTNEVLNQAAFNRRTYLRMFKISALKNASTYGRHIYIFWCFSLGENFGFFRRISVQNLLKIACGNSRRSKFSHRGTSVVTIKDISENILRTIVIHNLLQPSSKQLFELNFFWKCPS